VLKIDLKGTYEELKDYHQNKHNGGVVKRVTPRIYHNIDTKAGLQNERIKLRTAPNFYSLGQDNRLDALLKFDKQQPHYIYKKEPNLDIGNIWRAARRKHGFH